MYAYLNCSVSEIFQLVYKSGAYTTANNLELSNITVETVGLCSRTTPEMLLLTLYVMLLIEISVFFP